MAVRAGTPVPDTASAEWQAKARRRGRWIGCLAIPVLGVLMLCAGGVWFLLGWAQGLLLAPADSPVTAYVDDDDPVELAAGRGLQVRVGQGEHKVRFVWPDGREHTADLEPTHGFQTWVIPAAPDHCQVVLDVSTYFYGALSADSRRWIPTVDGTSRGEPFSVTVSQAVFHSDELPEYLDSDSEISIARELPCEALELPAPLLVRSLGYVGDSFDDWMLETQDGAP